MKFVFVILFFVISLYAKVDINHAAKKELMGLNGVGSSKADAIIGYRDKKCFDNVDELTKVKGIGKKLLEKNRENIEANECKKEKES